MKSSKLEHSKVVLTPEETKRQESNNQERHNDEIESTSLSQNSNDSLDSIEKVFRNSIGYNDSTGSNETIESDSNSPSITPLSSTSTSTQSSILIPSELLIKEPQAVPISTSATTPNTTNFLGVFSPITALKNLLSSEVSSSTHTTEPKLQSPKNVPSPINLSPTYSMVSFYPFYGNRPKVFPFNYIPCILGCSEDLPKSINAPKQSKIPPPRPPQPNLSIPIPPPQPKLLIPISPQPKLFIPIPSISSFPQNTSSTVEPIIMKQMNQPTTITQPYHERPYVSDLSTDNFEPPHRPIIKDGRLVTDIHDSKILDTDQHTGSKVTDNLIQIPKDVEKPTDSHFETFDTWKPLGDKSKIIKPNLTSNDNKPETTGSQQAPTSHHRKNKALKHDLPQKSEVPTSDQQNSKVPTHDVQKSEVDLRKRKGLPYDLLNSEVPTSDLRKTKVPTPDIRKSEIPISDQQISQVDQQKRNIPSHDLRKIEVSTSDLRKTEVTSSNQGISEVSSSEIGKTEVQSSILGRINIQNPDIDIKALRKESFDKFNPKTTEANFTTGISGIKHLVDVRSKVEINDDEQMDFIDYFAKKDGYVYIGILETFFVTYYEKTRIMIHNKEKKYAGAKKKCEEARNKISEIYKIIQVNDEKELQDFDFPAALERDCRVFEIDYMPKVILIAKLHNYGVQMILHYVKLLTNRKTLAPINVYKFATELMADIVVLCYGIFSRISEFLTDIIEYSRADQLKTYTMNYLVTSCRHLVDCICDEIGAIGESCSQVMIRITNLERYKVLEALTNIYKQVNYANISIARAMEALAPAIHFYHVKNFI